MVIHRLDAAVSRSPGLPTQVYRAVVDGIVSGALEPGQRIVLEHLAEQLGVSPTPVREALARLIQEGLIQEASGRRLCVIPLSEGYVLDTFYVRGALEGLAAELAAKRMTKSQLVRLKERVQASADRLDQGEFDVYIESDRLLHQMVLDAADNSILTRELLALQNHINYIRGYSQRHSGEHLQKSQREHEIIVDALTLQEPELAREAMESHIRATCKRVVRLINFHAQAPASTAPSS